MLAFILLAIYFLVAFSAKKPTHRPSSHPTSVPSSRPTAYPTTTFKPTVSHHGQTNNDDRLVTLYVLLAFTFFKTDRSPNGLTFSTANSTTNSTTNISTIVHTISTTFNTNICTIAETNNESNTEAFSEADV